MSHQTADQIIYKIYSAILGRDAAENERHLIYKKADTEKTFASILDATLNTLCSADDFLLLEQPNSKFNEIKKQDIFYAYKFLFGRFPENAQTYEMQAKIGNVSDFIEAAVASEEFKTNAILKNIVSLKRKPLGFQTYKSQYFNFTNARIIVLSGCQGKMLADLLQAKTGATFIPNIFIGGGQNLQEFVATGGESLSHILSDHDLIYTQKIEIFRTLRSSPAHAAKARFIPLIEYSGFQPDQCYINDTQTGKPVIGPLGEYQSAIAASGYFSGLTVDQTCGLFNSDTYALFDFTERSQQSRSRLLEQSSISDFPMGELLRKWDSKLPWMRTINHPKKHVLNDLVDIALSREGLTAIPNAEEFVIDDLAANVDWPMYPGLQQKYDSKAIYFKLPKAFSPDSNSATFLNLESFVSLTFQSLSALPFEQSFCHQLGRPVKIFDTLRS